MSTSNKSPIFTTHLVNYHKKTNDEISKQFLKMSTLRYQFLPFLYQHIERNIKKLVNKETSREYINLYNFILSTHTISKIKYEFLCFIVDCK